MGKEKQCDEKTQKQQVKQYLDNIISLVQLPCLNLVFLQHIPGLLEMAPAIQYKLRFTETHLKIHSQTSLARFRMNLMWSRYGTPVHVTRYTVHGRIRNSSDAQIFGAWSSPSMRYAACDTAIRLYYTTIRMDMQHEACAQENAVAQHDYVLR